MHQTWWWAHRPRSRYRRSSPRRLHRSFYTCPRSCTPAVGVAAGIAMSGAVGTAARLGRYIALYRVLKPPAVRHLTDTADCPRPCDEWRTPLSQQIILGRLRDSVHWCTFKNGLALRYLYRQEPCEIPQSFVPPRLRGTGRQKQKGLVLTRCGRWNTSIAVFFFPVFLRDRSELSCARDGALRGCGGYPRIPNVWYSFERELRP